MILINQVLFNRFKQRHPFFSIRLMNNLFFYHLFFFLVYYFYAAYNPSDSLAYFSRPQSSSLKWWDYFGTSTTFIDFISWPFINLFGFSYEMMMLLYSWFGFLGFLYAYLFFRENIPIKIQVFKSFDFLTLILFLPNMHFWTASLGKGAPIFMGLMMFAYSLGNTKQRWNLLLLGSFLIYFIRPHVFLFVALGTVLGYFTGKGKVSFGRKFLVTLTMIVGLILAKDSILAIAGLDGSEEIVEEFEEFSQNRAVELSKSGSGVSMASYPLPLKLFTFWFRPLFFDAPGLLGLIVSVENLIYLLLFFKIFRKGFIKFIRKSPISVKMSLTVFFFSSLAMTFVMSNLGIIMRQKSMVMYFLFFVIYYFVAQEKYDRILLLKKKRAILAKRDESAT